MSEATIMHDNDQIARLSALWRSPERRPAAFPLVIRYRDFDSQWYRSVCILERNVLNISSNAQGNVTFLQFTAKSDGKDYPEYTDDLLAELVATGKQMSLSYSEKITDDYVTEWTDKENGKITAQGTRTISKDGKTMTLTVICASPKPRLFHKGLIFSDGADTLPDSC